MTGRTLTRFSLFTTIFLIASTVPALAGDATIPSPVNPLMITPFILLLLSIAILPFMNKHWWDKNYPYVSFGLGFITIAYYLFGVQNTGSLLNTGMEYLSFILLIGSLFVVAGGIHIRVRGKSTPMKNVLFLAIGVVLSNFLGTTGASVILIRPFLRVNHYRLRGYHVVFFIFLVSNIGGALTPIGDPPLFLGYLNGVPFFWVIANVWHIWACTIALILLIFWVIDYRSFKKYEEKIGGGEGIQFDEEAEVHGLPNVLFLGVILLAVFIQKPPLLREALMVIAAAGSYITTKKEIHLKNNFNFVPIKEVAILFFGIFTTMIPALDWLQMNAAKVGITSAGQFYWGAGALSSFLDNAPTYMNFLSGAIGIFVDSNTIQQVQHLITTQGADIGKITGAHPEEIRATFTTLVKYHSDLVATNTVPVSDIQVAYLIANQSVYLKAISIAAVFFGANTYIGNGPNFMVKSIAEHAHAKCPHFAEYMLKYSLPVLVPVFVVVWWIWFT